MACLTVTLAGMCASTWAEEGAVNITAGAQPREVVVSVQNGPNNCGMEIRFGDSREVKKRLNAGEVWTVNHSYAGDGNFAIKAEGVLVVRGLRTVGPCTFGNEAMLAVAGANASLQAAVAPAPAVTKETAPSAQSAAAAQGAQGAQGAHQDMVLMVRKGSSNLKFVNTLEGGKRLTNGAQLGSYGTSVCIVKMPNAYVGLTDATVENVVRVELRRYLAQIANVKEVPLRTNECIVGDGSSARFTASSELVLVQRQALPILANASPDFAQGFELLHEIGFANLFTLADQMRQRNVSMTLRHE